MLPVIETERLILRNIDMRDHMDMYEYAKTPYVGPNAGWEPHKSITQTMGIIAMMINNPNNGSLGTFAIVLKEENRMIGTIELFNMTQSYKAELGYALNYKYWGQGIVPEAARAIIHWGFVRLNLKRIEINLFPTNHQSERVCQKLGFVKEGLLRNAYLRYDGKIFDEIKYSMTDDEYYEKYLNKGKAA